MSTRTRDRTRQSRSTHTSSNSRGCRSVRARGSSSSYSRGLASSRTAFGRSSPLPDGTTRTVELYARGGAIGIAELTERGDLHYTELPRVRTHRTYRTQDKNGKYRWYNDYRLPHHYGDGTITVRLHGDDNDAKRKLNRTENVRPIPPTDPDFARLYRRRNDAESINRNLDDTLWLGRAHSLGHQRQHLNLLGYALMTNGLALHRQQRKRNTIAA